MSAAGGCGRTMATIGEQFRAARTARRMTVAEAAEATRIKPTHIEAMERDDFSGMASPIYARGFIKLYAEALDLDPGLLLQAYAQTHAPTPRLPMEADAQGRVRPRRRPDERAGGVAAWYGRLRLPDPGLLVRGAVWLGGVLLVLGLVSFGIRTLRARPRPARAPRGVERYPVLEPPPAPFVDGDAFGDGGESER